MAGSNSQKRSSFSNVLLKNLQKSGGLCVGRIESRRSDLRLQQLKIYGNRIVPRLRFTEVSEMEGMCAALGDELRKRFLCPSRK